MDKPTDTTTTVKMRVLILPSKSMMILLMYRAADIGRGFQPIGAFHKRNHLAMNMGMQAQASAFGR